MAASFKGKFFKFGARLIRRKSILKTAAQLHLNITKARKESNEIPSKLRRKYVVTEDRRNNCLVYTLSPKGRAPKSHLLYLHGGAYTFEMVKEQWDMLRRFVDAFDCAITIPIYPLAPEYGAREVWQMLVPLYRDLIKKFPDLSLIGDSAGGGMCVSLAQQARAMGMAPAKHLILISPWLDLSMSNQEIPAFEACDVILSAPGLLEAGRLFAQDLSLTDPVVSPIYGDLEGIPPVAIFMGTHDLFLPDVRIFKSLLERAKIHVDYHEYEEMFHVWIAVDVPESRDAIQKIKSLLGQNKSTDLRSSV